MHYKVLVNDPTAHKPSSLANGYIANWLDNTQPAIYTLGEARKKARAFEGKAVPIETEYNVSESNLLMVEMNASVLDYSVKQLLLSRQTAGNIGKSIVFDSDIFGTLIKELRQAEKEDPNFKIKAEVRKQLNELNQIIVSDYVLIHDMCLS